MPPLFFVHRLRFLIHCIPVQVPPPQATSHAFKFHPSRSDQARDVMNIRNSLKSISAKQRGFTMVELITVMIIVGIMAAVAAPKFFDNTAYQNRGAADQVKAALRFAQKAAIAERLQSVSVTIAALSSSSNCNLVISGYSVTCNISNSVTVSPALPQTYYFNSKGEPVSSTGTVYPSTQSITVGGITDTIEQETGYVH